MARIKSQLVLKYLPKSVTTLQENLNRARKKSRFTQVPIEMDPSNTDTHLVFTIVVDAGKVHPDQTGSFIVTYSRVVKYVFISYSYNTNKVFSDTLKSRIGKDILHAYNTCHEYLKEIGFKPKINWLDNKASNALNEYNQNQGVDVQLVLIL